MLYPLAIWLLFVFAQTNALQVRPCGELPGSGFSSLNSELFYDGGDFITSIATETWEGNWIVKTNIGGSSITSEIVSTLPGLIHNAAAAVDHDGNILHFGGSRTGSWVRGGGPGPNFRPTDAIYKISPNGSEVVELNVKLSEPRRNHGVFTFGDHIYIFGGIGERRQIETVEAYNMKTGEITIAGKLGLFDKVSMYNPVSVFDGQYVYVFNAQNIYDSGLLPGIHRMNPKTFEVEVLEMDMPGIKVGSVALVDKIAYIIPGDYSPTEHLIIFNMETLTPVVSEFEIRSRARTASVYVESQQRIYVFGVHTSGPVNQDVICIDL